MQKQILIFLFTAYFSFLPLLAQQPTRKICTCGKCAQSKAALMQAQQQASQEQIEDPIKFVETLYTYIFKNNQDSDVAIQNVSEWFTPQFLELYRKEKESSYQKSLARRADGTVILGEDKKPIRYLPINCLSWDPFTWSQEPLHNFNVIGAQASGKEAKVGVDLILEEPGENSKNKPKRVIIFLKRHCNSWQVDNLRAEGCEQDLVAILREFIATKE